MEIKQKFIDFNRSPNRNKPEYIVIHDTANQGKGADAEAHYRYFNGGDRQASAHYFVDDKQVLQLVKDSDASWHTGMGYKGKIHNGNSIGVELCINQDGDRGMAIEKLFRLVLVLVKRHNIPLEKVVRHFDASGKMCPRTMSHNNWEHWHNFKKSLADELLTDVLVEQLNPVTPQWKLTGLQELHEAGLVDDLKGWTTKLDEPMPAWAVFTVLNRIRKAGL